MTRKYVVVLNTDATSKGEVVDDVHTGTIAKVKKEMIQEWMDEFDENHQEARLSVESIYKFVAVTGRNT